MLGPWQGVCRRVQQALFPPSPACSISTVLDLLLWLCLVLLCSPLPSSSQALIPVVFSGSLEPTWTPKVPPRSHRPFVCWLELKRTCALLTPPSSCNKGSPLCFLSAWDLLRVVYFCILHHSALVLHSFPGFLLSQVWIRSSSLLCTLDSAL